MDRIEIRGLRACGYHGVLEQEWLAGQEFIVDVTVEGDLSAAVASDDLSDTIDYATLAQRLVEAVEKTRFNLLEALAGHLADLALADPRVATVTLRVAKPEAPMPVSVTEVAVQVRRERTPGPAA